MRKLSLVMAGVLGAGTPLISQAATLGEARVQSFLSEPLDVRVPLSRSSDEPLDEITVKLAPPSFYREAGVPLENITGNLTFNIQTDGGREYVLIGSKRPIRDPILRILLEVGSPQGRMIREYNLLLDPPSVGGSKERRPAQGASTGPESTSSSRRTSAVATGWQRVDPAENVSFDSNREVERGDTLYEIAREFVTDGNDIRPMMQAIIDANPSAFTNGNGNALLAGASLRVPGKGASDSDADQEVGNGEEGAPGEDREASSETGKLPALQLLGPEEEGAESEPAAPADLGGFGDLSREQPLAAIVDGTAEGSGAPGDREAALDQEEVESVRAENEALTEQLRALKDQIDSVSMAVDERDAQIAELQAAVQQSRAELQGVEQSAGEFWVQWGKYLTGALGLVIIALIIALALRRNRRDDEPGVPMPTTADTSRQRVAERDPAIDTATAAGTTMAAGTAAVGGAATTRDRESGELSSDSGEDMVGTSTRMDDPMNPEMALEEARVLESFNLTHQAVELLQDSLTEHPGDTGLQAALNRLKGIEGDAPAAESQAPAVSPQTNEAELTDETRDTSGESQPEPSAATPAVDEPPESSDEQNDKTQLGSWDDPDDMLATSDSEPGPVDDERTADLDDSFALETPANGGSADEIDSSTRHEAGDLDLPDNETPPASVVSSSKDSERGEPESLDLDLTGYEPAGTETAEPDPAVDEDRGMDLDLGETPQTQEPTPADAPEEVSADADADIDTRVGLAEAFLDVGDSESFDMIEAELREEGATGALERLEELKKRYQG
ncbi:MAG: hypothetical protein ABR561_05015 [Guyparkeria sp.]